MKHMRLKGIANAIAVRVVLWKQPTDRHSIRDYCDLQTGGGLDYWQLDLLTDMVIRRLQKENDYVNIAQ